MMGIGYQHPTWDHGMYKGGEVFVAETWNVSELDCAPTNQHVHSVVRAIMDGEIGHGVIERAFSVHTTAMDLRAGLILRDPKSLTGCVVFAQMFCGGTKHLKKHLTAAGVQATDIAAAAAVTKRRYAPRPYWRRRRSISEPRMPSSINVR